MNPKFKAAIEEHVGLTVKDALVHHDPETNTYCLRVNFFGANTPMLDFELKGYVGHSTLWIRDHLVERKWDTWPPACK